MSLHTAQKLISFANLMFPMLAIGAGAALMLQLWTGSIPNYQISINAMTIGLLPAWWWGAYKLRLDNLPVQLAWISIVFAGGVFGMGATQGERDRRLPHDELTEGRMVCAGQVVLSPIGERFVSVTKDDRRHIINEDCKVQFDFGNIALAPDENLSQLVFKTIANRVGGSS